MFQRREGKQSRKKIKFDECGQWRGRHEVSSISSWELPLCLLPFCLLQPCPPTYFPLPSALPLPPLFSFPPFLSTFSLLQYIPTYFFPFYLLSQSLATIDFLFCSLGFALSRSYKIKFIKYAASRPIFKKNILPVYHDHLFL